MNRLGSVLKHICMLLFSVLISIAICLVAFFILSYTNWSETSGKMNSATNVLSELESNGNGYSLSENGQKMLSEMNEFAFVLDENGKVIWAYDKPEDVKDKFTASEIAVFSKWFLGNYPVTVRVCGENDGDLLVVGSRRTDLAKYNLTYSVKGLYELRYIIPGLAGCVFVIIFLLSGLSERRERRERDRARACWIDGISHDIRTPLALVMGYAEEWQDDSSLSGEQAKQAHQMVIACNRVKSLISDLNLTMRLDYKMQPLKKDKFVLSAMLRETIAELVNSGEATDVEPDIPQECNRILVRADRRLMQRAVTNLIINAARYKSSGPVRVRMSEKNNRCFVYVENKMDRISEEELTNLNRNTNTRFSGDGTAMHGTGLQLVRQIAKAHGGKLVFTGDDTDGCHLIAALSFRK